MEDRPLRIFYSHAPEDAPLLAELERHLVLLERSGLINGWHAGRIPAGLNQDEECQRRLQEAEITILMVSMSYMASDRCFAEMALALRNGNTRSIPILLREGDWEAAPIAGLQVLPRDKVPVMAWPDRDRAWSAVADGIRVVAEELRAARRSGAPTPRSLPFDAQVAELYRLLHYEVEAGRILGGASFDLHLTLRPGDITVQRVVACIPGPGSPADVDAFGGKVRAAWQEAPGLIGTIVSGVFFSGASVTRAEALGIKLITLPELSARLLEGSTYARRLIEEIEADGKYPVDHYIQPSIALGSGEPDRSAPEVLEEWLDDPTWNQMTLLGDVGTGKTFLSRMLARRLAAEYLRSPVDNPLPILVDLRNADRQLSLEGLLLTHLHNHGLPRTTFDIFQHALSAGRVVMIFDGFDEMATRVTPRITMLNFQELSRCVRGRAKVLLTCRTHYFKSREDEEVTILDAPGKECSDETSELYWDLVIRKGFQIVYLRPFGTVQIEEYVTRVKGASAKDVLARIRDTYNLMELSRRPMLLDMIVRSIDRLSEDMNAADLYQVFTGMWIHRDRWRPALAPRQKLDLLISLAWHLFQTKKSSIHYTDLFRHLEQSTRPSSADPGYIVDIDNEVRTASFLIRDSAGNYTFAHKSYAEFFLAQHLLRGVLSGQVECLDLGRVSPEVVAFVWDLAKGEQRQAVSERLRAVLDGPYRMFISENALLCLHGLPGKKPNTGDGSLPPSRVLRIEMPGAQLDGVSLDGLQAPGAVLSDARLAGAMLAGARLCDADLSRVNLQGADLRRADLSNARLAHACLREANLEGCVLKGASFDHADLTNAVMVGADHEGVDFSKAVVTGTVFGENQPRRELSTSCAARSYESGQALQAARHAVMAFARRWKIRNDEEFANDVVLMAHTAYQREIGTATTLDAASLTARALAIAGRQSGVLRHAAIAANLVPVECLDSMLTGQRSPEEEVLVSEASRLIQERLQEALDKLDEPSRSLLRAYYVEGNTTGQLASMLGVSHSTVVRRLASIRHRLLREIDVDTDEPSYTNIDELSPTIFFDRDR